MTIPAEDVTLSLTGRSSTEAEAEVEQQKLDVDVIPNNENSKAVSMLVADTDVIKDEKVAESTDHSIVETDVDNDDDEEEKIDIKFVFANRDGLHVTTSFSPSDTVAEVKAVLMSLWPTNDLGDVPEKGNRIRMICMGKGFLMPDTRTLTDCEVPIFKHPTPINICVKPESSAVKEVSSFKGKAMNSGQNYQPTQTTSSEGCCCCIS